MVLSLDMNNKSFEVINSYMIEMIGFTRLSLLQFSFENDGNINKAVKNTFVTVCYPNQIEAKDILSGTKTKTFKLEEETISDVTFMLKV